MAHFKISLGLIIDYFIYGSTGMHVVSIFEYFDLENLEQFLKLNYFLLRFTSSATITIGTLVLIAIRIKVYLRKLKEPIVGEPEKPKKKFWDLFNE